MACTVCSVRPLGIIIAAVAIAGCTRSQRAQPSPTPTVIAIAPPSNLTPPTATAGAATPPPSSFVAVARLGDDAATNLYSVGDRPVLVQSRAEQPLSLMMLARDGRRIELAKGIDADARHGDIILVTGSGPEDAWLSTYFVAPEGAMAFDMRTWRVGRAQKTTRVTAQGLRAVGELHPGHWVGLPFAVHPGYLLDDPPQKLRTFAGSGPVPTVSPEISLFSVAFLGEGRMCGVGGTLGASAGRYVLWDAGPNGARSTPLGDAVELGQPTVVRGPSGECVVVASTAEVTRIIRMKGDSLQSLTLGRSISAVSAARDGTLWAIDAHDVVHIGVLDDHLDVRAVPLPRPPVDGGAAGSSGGAGCELAPLSIVAFAEDDVWVTVSCRGSRASTLLLHTEPPRARIEDWAGPP